MPHRNAMSVGTRNTTAAGAPTRLRFQNDQVGGLQRWTTGTVPDFAELEFADEKTAYSYQSQLVHNFAPWRLNRTIMVTTETYMLFLEENSLEKIWGDKTKRRVDQERRSRTA